jgi:hypothetical protein
VQPRLRFLCCLQGCFCCCGLPTISEQGTPKPTWRNSMAACCSLKWWMWCRYSSSSPPCRCSST